MTTREEKAAEMKRVYDLGVKYVKRLEKVVKYKPSTIKKTAQQFKLILIITIIVRRAQWELKVIEDMPMPPKFPKGGIVNGVSDEIILKK
jgi:hypothetical protein